MNKIGSTLKKLFFVILIVPVIFFAQNRQIDSLKTILKTAKQDTNRANILSELSLIFAQNKTDTALMLCNEALALSQKLNYTKGEGWAELRIGLIYSMKHNYTEAMLHYNKVLNLCEALLSSKNPLEIRSAKKLKSATFDNIGAIFKFQANYPKALQYYFKGLKLAEEVGDMQQLGRTFNNIAIVYKAQSNYSVALKYYFKGLKFSEGGGNKKLVGMTLNNIANVYYDQADYPRALQYYFKGLKLSEEVKDNMQVGRTLGNIANVYYSQLDYPSALKYYFKGLKIAEEVGYTQLIGVIVGNIASLYHAQDDYPRALEYFLKALKLSEEVGDKQGVGMALGNIARVYHAQADSAFEKGNKNFAFSDRYPKALEYYLKGLKISEEVGDKESVGSIHGVMGNLYTNLGKYKEAEFHLKKALSISKEIGAGDLEKNHHKFLTTLYEKTKRPALALEHYKKFIALRDTIYSQENTKKLIRSEMDHQYEKEKLVSEAGHQKEIEKQNAVAEEKNRKQKVITYSVVTGLGLVLILALFILRSNRQKQKANHIITLQKKEVEDQKHQIEEKHKEITDSINYAERIQRSFLATEEHLSGNLAQYFVMFRPKDVVSGDFYWSATLNNGNFILAVADSTGHGVPGAIMSLLNITSLEKAIENEIDPSAILNITRKIIIERLKKDGSAEGGKDGMDGSLLSFDFKNNVLHCASANNPVWIIRGSELIEIKADRFPIGKHDRDKTTFTLHTLNLQKGDVVYSLTDGFPDQFGGKDGKKFKYKQLQNLLLSISSELMETQKYKLNDAFDKWKGNLEQVDDVCLIGIRI